MLKVIKDETGIYVELPREHIQFVDKQAEILYDLALENDSLERENKQLKEQLQKKEDIINKANTYVIENANIYLNFMGNKVGFFKENDGKTPIELLEILDRNVK